jgi:hypothetical protein
MLSKFLEGRQPPTPKFYMGRDVPDELLESPAMIDFYLEHLDKAINGFSYRGTQMTGDHYWYLNFWPIRLNLPDPNGGKIPIEKLDYPYWSAADDYVFKQFEEARQEGMMSMLFTGRGFGKTYGVSSINGKGYVTNPLHRGVFSAAVDKHVNNTWDYFKESLTEMEARHPFLRRGRLLDSQEFIKAGFVSYPQGMAKTESFGQVEKILYDKDPGKTRGRRLNFQLFEEAGDWSCPASLKECILASLGSWRVGKLVKVRAFIVGTGGSVKSPQAEDLFYNPEAFSIYPVTQWENRKTGIFMPATTKLGGFYETKELRGVPDEEEAKKWLLEERARIASDPQSQKRFIQEFPLTPRECFEQSGAAWFNRTLLASQLYDLNLAQSSTDPKEKLKVAKRGQLIRINMGKGEDGQYKSKIQFVEDPEGPFWIFEQPLQNQHGGLAETRNVYVAGLDSIDQSKLDSATPDGSKLACLIKKRMTGLQQTGNLYVAAYVERPDGPVEIAYENVLKLLEWYNANVNIEYSKISFISYARNHGAYHRLMKRPKVFLSDKENEDFGLALIGTPMTDGTKNLGINKVRTYVEQCCYLIPFIPLIEQLLNYQPKDQTLFDWVVAMMLCEIADEDMIDQVAEIVTPPKPWAQIGFYTDPFTGYMTHGIIPGTGEVDEMKAIDVTSKERLKKGRVYFLEADGTPSMTNPLHSMIPRDAW